MISKALDLSLTKSFAALNSLQTQLNKAVDDWAKQLPGSGSLTSVAMYLDINSNNSNDTFLKAVCDKLEKRQLPSHKALSAALLEKWRECKANGADQKFFLTEETKAKTYISSLAKVILAVLVQEKDLFNNFVHAELSHLRKENKQILATLQSLEKLIRKNESTKKPTRKIFRPIPDCRIPLVNGDDDERRDLVSVLLKISLFKSFSEIKYHKFTCLMTYSNDAFYEGENDMGGLTLYTGEIDFLSNLSNLVDVFLEDSKVFIETVDSYYNNPNFLKFKARAGLLGDKGLQAYEFEIDGPAHRFSILPIHSNNDIDYDHMGSLNSTLRLMPTMTRPSIFVIDIDRVKESPIMTRFIYCCLLEDKIDLSRIRVNVDDFDDWDFEYVLNSKNRSLT
jgi:hypothetical protein